MGVRKEEEQKVISVVSCVSQYCFLFLPVLLVSASVWVATPFTDLKI